MVCDKWKNISLFRQCIACMQTFTKFTRVWNNTGLGRTQSRALSFDHTRAFLDKVTLKYQFDCTWRYAVKLWNNPPNKTRAKGEYFTVLISSFANCGNAAVLNPENDLRTNFSFQDPTNANSISFWAIREQTFCCQETINKINEQLPTLPQWQKRDKENFHCQLLSFPLWEQESDEQASEPRRPFCIF